MPTLIIHRAGDLALRCLAVRAAPVRRFEVRREKRTAVADAAITKLVNVNGPPPVVVGVIPNSKDGRATVTAAFDGDDGVSGRQCVGRAPDDRVELGASG